MFCRYDDTKLRLSERLSSAIWYGLGGEDTHELGDDFRFGMKSDAWGIYILVSYPCTFQISCGR